MRMVIWFVLFVTGLSLMCLSMAKRTRAQKRKGDLKMGGTRVLGLWSGDLDFIHFREVCLILGSGSYSPR
jgi:hypothetical protein